ncbi:glutathione S-transferase family protein [Erythrobacter sp. F6033]|uniref:glutathione S-transferase family protein n=1 Tax=Erythrobacter sp. F6033 TaxID=2926401 RepID=UPI001FF1337A|nr:glutathione S-transferase family protein [Erythrobacter sp. F6033]MCK0129241.1 glutathione S-transferase family protein [Erythrobacter sp. F6033]
MVMLQECDIQTKEVLDWKGLHLFHFKGSTCSQKIRIFLRLKGIEWTSHHLDLARKQHLTPFYMGINPRGLVPTLVHDGKVIIESNDILAYLEAQFPEPALTPSGESGRIATLLKAEDDLHLDIRALTMRFVFPSFLTKRLEKDISAYERAGSGTVEGERDEHREHEMTFWRDMNTNGGITDGQADKAVARFREALNRFEEGLGHHRYLAGDSLTLVDIAWYIYARRLLAAGYPMARWHPSFSAWFDQLDARSEFRDEVPSGGIVGAIAATLHAAQRLKGSTLEDVITKSQRPAT